MYIRPHLGGIGSTVTYVEMDKLRHLLTEVNPQIVAIGQCELCGTNRVDLYMVGGTYACGGCRGSILTRLKNEENILTGAGGRPDSRHKEANGGAFTRGGRIVPAPVDTPKPQSSFEKYLQHKLEPAVKAYADAAMLNPETVREMTGLMMQGTNPQAQQAYAENIRRATESDHDKARRTLQEAVDKEKRRQAVEEEKRWQEARESLQSQQNQTTAPGSGESSTPPVAASSAFASGSPMPQASPSIWASLMSLLLQAHSTSNSSGSPTGQPSAASSKSIAPQTTTKDARYLYPFEDVPYDTRVEAKKLVADSTVEKVAEMTVTWPFPEEESQPVIGQLLPLDIKPER